MDASLVSPSVASKDRVLLVLDRRATKGVDPPSGKSHE